jgi:hypothetical protein
VLARASQVFERILNSHWVDGRCRSVTDVARGDDIASPQTVRDQSCNATVMDLAGVSTSGTGSRRDS